jgi:hypothetical protein
MHAFLAKRLGYESVLILNVGPKAQPKQEPQRRPCLALAVVRKFTIHPRRVSGGPTSVQLPQTASLHGNIDTSFYEGDQASVIKQNLVKSVEAEQIDVLPHPNSTSTYSATCLGLRQP